MINELHSCLLYRKQASGEVIGEDYQEPGIEFPALGASATAVHQALMLDKTRPETQNWRALELRRAIQGCDLNNLLYPFDRRTGYYPSDLVDELTRKFRPTVSGGPAASRVRVTGKYRNTYYRCDTWTLRVGALQWSIEARGFTPATGNISGESIVRAPMPGHDGHVLFPGDVEGTYVITWAASPTQTFADTAAALRDNLKKDVYTLSQSSNSRYNDDERSLLYNVAVGGGEVVSQVCAAALLFAGHAAQYVSNSDKDSA